MPKNYITIDGLPNDKNQYVITSYDGNLPNHSFATDIPLVKVSLGLVKGGKLIKHFASSIIGLPELIVARIGTIWQSQAQIEGHWKKYKGYEENISLSFDLEKISARCVRYRKNEINGNLELIELDDNNKDESDNNFYGSSFIEFTSEAGIKYIVPALELFMSTYLPRNKLIRNELLLNSINTVLKNHVNDFKCSPSLYQIHIDKQLEPETSVFLAYLACNEHSRSVIGKIWTNLECSKTSGIKDICIFPYHPKQISFKASGVWLSNGVFYIQRLYESKAPNEIIIRAISKKTASIPKKANKENTDSDAKISAVLNNAVIENETKVSHKTNPSGNAGMKYIVSDVSPDNSELNIEQIEEIDNIIDSENLCFKEDNEVNSASSGKLKGADELKNIARTHYVIDEPHERLPFIEEIDTALTELTRGEEPKLLDIAYIDDYGIEHANLVYSSFSAEHIGLSDEKFWASGYVKNSGIKRSKSGYRKLYIVKITIRDMQPMYLLEIVRKVKSDSFFGLVFQLSADIDYTMLENIKNVLASNKGHFVGENITPFPINNAIRIKHKWGSMKQRFENVFEIIKERKLFR
ncbi:MAG: hypothetical protein WC279_01040 [Sulfurimonas sp.]|uniref:hypothetical protein n=1 Tax=Sulfurimonas sp. TaxID=2022749 RepID=UPI003562293C